MAVQWLINEDPLELFANDTPTQTRLTQRYSLLTLWYSTNGPSWFQNQGWLTAENECTWFGITCNSNMAVVQIGSTEMTLLRNNLSGHIPPDIALLKSTQYIQAANNPNLVGPLPSSFGNFEEINS